MAKLLDATKKALRIMASTDFDDEIGDIISACIADMQLSGINIPDYNSSDDKDLDDPLIKRAVILYAKANFGNDPDSEKFFNSYILLKISLALSGFTLPAPADDDDEGGGL
jgi:hypothetical protein